MHFRGEKKTTDIETDFINLMKLKEDGYLPETIYYLAREGNICLNISFKMVIRLSENFRFWHVTLQTWLMFPLQGPKGKLKTEKRKYFKRSVKCLKYTHAHKCLILITELGIGKVEHPYSKHSLFQVQMRCYVGIWWKFETSRTKKSNYCTLVTFFFLSSGETPYIGLSCAKF